jgi:hypothetical protein
VTVLLFTTYSSIFRHGGLFFVAMNFLVHAGACMVVCGCLCIVVVVGVDGVDGGVYVCEVLVGLPIVVGGDGGVCVCVCVCVLCVCTLFAFFCYLYIIGVVGCA